MAGFTRGARKRRPAALDLEDSIDLLASLMRGASHVVFVTGAGLSTNAGIRDYRGPDGIWTEAAAKGLVAAGFTHLNLDDGFIKPKPKPAVELVGQRKRSGGSRRTRSRRCCCCPTLAGASPMARWSRTRRSLRVACAPSPTIWCARPG